MYKLYKSKTHQFVFKNAMQAVWLDYTTKYLIEQDMNLIDFFEHGDEGMDHHIREMPLTNNKKNNEHMKSQLLTGEITHGQAKQF